MIGLSVVIEQLLETSRTRIIYTFKLVFYCRPFHYRDVSKFAVKLFRITCSCLLAYYTKGDVIFCSDFSKDTSFGTGSLKKRGQSSAEAYCD